RPPSSPLFPYTTLFRSARHAARWAQLPPEVAMPEPQVRVFPSNDDLFRAAAETFCQIGSEAIREHGKYTVALSGGSTPRDLHREDRKSTRLNSSHDQIS